MDGTTAALLCAAGLVGGIIASLAGGAALVTFPALLAAGLPPVTAAASNLAALMPGSFIAALSDRTQLPPVNRAFAALVAASVVGATIGASLLLLTSNRMFEILVPVLLGFATILFAFGERISAFIRARSQDSGPGVRVTSLPILLPVSIYGGYFGAGLGVLLVGVLSIGTAGQYRPANATKNLVASLNGGVAAVVLASHGSVSWPATLIMMSGALVGSLIGAHIARYAPQALMRVVVVFFGISLTAVYVWRYWF